MATTLIHFRATDVGREWQRLQTRLKRVSDGKALRMELNRRIRVKGAAALASAKAAALTVDVTSSGDGGDSSGLRQRVANATEIRPLPSGIRIRVVAKRVDPKYGRSLARYLNATGGRPWVHPLFGNQERQFVQRGQEYFAPAIRAHAPEFRKGCIEAMREVADMIRG